MSDLPVLPQTTFSCVLGYNQGNPFAPYVLSTADGQFSVAGATFDDVLQALIVLLPNGSAIAIG
jgi:hypothetical protein